ncbi:cystathionine beta-lyase [Rouxiella silvae]|uniref:cysteine-S-conjugate beta-lyase n=1 Tax=Rouxiella silvae TaxID=1646373 RepID=A0ABX3U429_9GAMM|nr:cystathionine beta-lyase [Rouxiella silvae]
MNTVGKALSRKFDFKTVIDRRSRLSTKWLEVNEFTDSLSGPVIPLWIADMDFKSPPVVVDALQQAVEHGIFGYSEWPADFFALFCGWQEVRHGWRIDPQWVLPCESVISAMDIAIRANSQPDDEVIIFSPGFSTFNRIIKHTGRRVIDVPLVENERSYSLDIARLHAAITSRSRILILCNPHNPIGKVWRSEELRQIAELCQHHRLLLLSDDVHQDLIIGDTPYTPVASLDPQFADLTITFTSPCKPFNLSGLPITHLVIKNAEIRKKLSDELEELSVHQPNMLGMIACDAAYRHGAPWLDALIETLRGNYALLEKGLQDIANVTLFHTEGTYLAWLDFRKSGLTHAQLQQRLIKDAGLLPNSGLKFGTNGEGFMRLNFALPQSELVKVIDRLARCFSRSH